MFSGAANDPVVKGRNLQWSKQLTETMAIEDSEERGQKLEGWREWVGAKEAHPQGGVEHFLPLVVCAGAGGNGKGGSWADELFGMQHYTYYWE